jgi:hypothetical protein
MSAKRMVPVAATYANPLMVPSCARRASSSTKTSSARSENAIQISPMMT